jgi:hypothetical protein
MLALYNKTSDNVLTEQEINHYFRIVALKYERHIKKTTSLELIKCSSDNSSYFNHSSLEDYMEGLYCLRNPNDLVVEGKFEDNQMNFT